MRRLTVLIMLLGATLMWVATAGAQAPEQVTTAERETAAAVEAAGGYGAPGELVPVSDDAQKKAIVQAIWVLIIFLILLAILYPTAWKGVLNGLKNRESRIRKEIADAEAARAKAEQTLSQYNQQLAAAEDRVREMLAKAHADGERLAATIRETAGREADATRAKALSDIEDAKKKAIADIHNETVELSTAIAEKIIRRNLNPEDQRQLVQASLQQLDASRRN